MKLGLDGSSLYNKLDNGALEVLRVSRTGSKTGAAAVDKVDYYVSLLDMAFPCTNRWVAVNLKWDKVDEKLKELNVEIEKVRNYTAERVLRDNHIIAVGQNNIVEIPPIYRYV